MSELYSAEEAAQVLGLQVRTVRNYVREGRLPGVLHFAPGSYSSTLRLTPTFSRNVRSCETTSSAPVYARNACSRFSRLARSRCSPRIFKVGESFSPFRIPTRDWFAMLR